MNILSVTSCRLLQYYVSLISFSFSAKTDETMPVRSHFLQISCRKPFAEESALQQFFLLLGNSQNVAC